MTREVVRVVAAQDTSDGAGVRLRRALGTPALDHVDPFLLLDEFRSDQRDDYAAGFPDHPHRGFETVTYMLAGRMRHKDHSGNEGTLVPGGVQWMTAGRGIIHSEMPLQDDGLMWGFQLWVNLPARDKMGPPRYQEFGPDAIPEARRPDGVRVRVIAGEAEGRKGPVEGIATSPLYLDVQLPPGARFAQPLQAQHNALAYVFEGAAEIGPEGAVRPVAAGQLAVLDGGGSVEVRGSERGGRLLLIAARPLGEPVARYGPFVMNTREEIRKAVRDLQAGTFLT
jgi:redox-sensitive bicupin YhaK (pirin superfamily)